MVNISKVITSMGFGGSGGSGGTIGSATDVALNNSANKDILMYNGGVAKWQNQTLGVAGGIARLDQDGDVVNAAGVKVSGGTSSVNIPHNPDAATLAALPVGALYTTN